MRKYYALLMILFAVTMWSQDTPRRILKGKVTSELTDLEGIYILNLKSEQATLTDIGGYFSIMATEGDTLMFSSIQFKGRRIGISTADFGPQLFFVRLEGMINQIDEVIINKYNNIDAVSLGIIPKGQKKYTPAERKLRTAGDFKAMDLLGIIGGSFQVDPVLNAISGRTAMLKKELAVEKKEYLLEYISQMFEREYFTKNLNIPDIYVEGFWYYIIEDQKFVSTLKSRNREMATFLLGDLAADYLRTIANEK